MEERGGKGRTSWVGAGTSVRTIAFGSWWHEEGVGRSTFGRFAAEREKDRGTSALVLPACLRRSGHIPPDRPSFYFHPRAFLHRSRPYTHVKRVRSQSPPPKEGLYVPCRTERGQIKTGSARVRLRFSAFEKTKKTYVGLGRKELEGRLDDTSPQSEDKVKSGLLLDVVVRKGSAILELLAGEDESLLVRGDTLLVLDLGGLKSRTGEGRESSKIRASREEARGRVEGGGRKSRETGEEKHRRLRRCRKDWAGETRVGSDRGRGRGKRTRRVKERRVRRTKRQHRKEAKNARSAWRPSPSFRLLSCRTTTCPAPFNSLA
jgi:hypothetical protein